MTNWAELSFRLYEQPEILHRLSEIYSVGENQNRTVQETDKTNIREKYAAERTPENDVEFFLALITAKYEENSKNCVFPIDHSYVRYLSANVPAADRREQSMNNSIMVSMIIDAVHSQIQSFEKLIEAIESPIKASRQFGPAFKQWCESEFQNVYSSIDEWFASDDDVALYISGEDSTSIDWIRNSLNVHLATLINRATGVDLLAKVKKRNGVYCYIIGESKFLTDSGGSQKKQRDSAWGLAIDSNLPGDNGGNRSTGWNSGREDILVVALLDGICWIRANDNKFTSPNKYLASEAPAENYAFSALLLPQFLDSLKQR